MPLPIVAAIGQSLLGFLLVLVAVFLILLILVQRGRGGGLAGALGGMGGSSAFGAKAGDIFTRITVVAATIWIILCIVAARWGSSSESRLKVRGPAGANAPAGAAATLDGATEEPAAEPAAGSTDAAPAAATATPAADAPATETPAAAATPAAEAPAAAAPADSSSAE